jgi:hypothetical protein
MEPSSQTMLANFKKFEIRKLRAPGDSLWVDHVWYLAQPPDPTGIVWGPWERCVEVFNDIIHGRQWVR